LESGPDSFDFQFSPDCGLSLSYRLEAGDAYSNTAMVQIDESEKQIVIMSEDVNQLGLRNFDLTAYSVDAG